MIHDVGTPKRRRNNQYASVAPTPCVRRCNGRRGHAGRCDPKGWRSGPPARSISNPAAMTSRRCPAMLGVHQRGVVRVPELRHRRAGPEQRQPQQHHLVGQELAFGHVPDGAQRPGRVAEVQQDVAHEHEVERAQLGRVQVVDRSVDALDLEAGGLRHERERGRGPSAARAPIAADGGPCQSWRVASARSRLTTAPRRGGPSRRPRSHRMTPRRGSACPEIGEGHLGRGPPVVVDARGHDATRELERVVPGERVDPALEVGCHQTRGRASAARCSTPGAHAPVTARTPTAVRRFRGVRGGRGCTS